MLGYGSFGKVFRAKWNDADVAVKIIAHVAGMQTKRIEEEAELSLTLRHPNVVSTYFHVTRVRGGLAGGRATPPAAPGSVGGSAASESQAETNSLRAYMSPIWANQAPSEAHEALFKLAVGEDSHSTRGRLSGAVRQKVSGTLRRGAAGVGHLWSHLGSHFGSRGSEPHTTGEGYISTATASKRENAYSGSGGEGSLAKGGAKLEQAACPLPASPLVGDVGDRLLLAVKAG